VTHSGWTLPIPVLELLDAFQVKQSSEASAIVFDHSEVLILNSTAHLGKMEQALSVTPRHDSSKGLTLSHLANKFYVLGPILGMKD
jgi:hypothetical protein